MKNHVLAVIIAAAGVFGTPCIAQWMDISPDIPEPLYDIDFINASVGYVVGWDNEEGVIGRTVDGGETWTVLSVPSTYLFSVRFADELSGAIAGHDLTCNCAVFASTTDGGITWEGNDQFTGSAGIFRVEFADDKVGYAGGHNGAIMKTTDAGRTWSFARNDGEDVFMRLTVPSADTVYALARPDSKSTNLTLLYRTVNGGEDWHLLHDFTDEMTFGDIDFINTWEGVAAAWNGTHYDLIKTTDAGATWYPVHTSTDDQRFLTTVDMLPDGRGFAVGIGGTTAWTLDRGETWHVENVHPSANFTNVVIRGNQVYASGMEGLAMRRTALVSGVAEKGDDGDRRDNMVQDLGGGRFRFDPAGNGAGSLFLFDLLGQLVRRVSFGEASLILTLNDLPAGIYLYRVVGAGSENESQGKLRIH